MKQNKKLGVCHGVFDIIHAGHIEHFKFAKKQVDYLIVSITADSYVNKGPGRPIQNERRRQEVLNALKYIDEVIINRSFTALPIIEKYKPNIYFKGVEYKNEKDDITGNIKIEREAVEKYGGKIFYTKGFTDSSSRLIKSANLSILNVKQKEFIQKLKKQGISIEHIRKKFFEKSKNIDVMIIGEPIIDQFVKCTPLNMSSKNPIISVEETSFEEQFGGILAVSSAISSFGCNVTQILYNIDNRYKQKIEKHFSNIGVKSIFAKTTICQIPIKKRYISDFREIKMFEVSKVKSRDTHNADLKPLSDIIKKYSKKSDLIIGLNFGHGLWDNNTFNVKNINISAMNVQSNSENYGYNFFNKKENKGDLIILDEQELRLSQQDRFSKLTDLLKGVNSKLINYNEIVLTTGKNGSMNYIEGEIIECPSFAENVFDAIGSGDAFFSIYSLCHFLKLDKLTSSFIANVYAAEHTRFLGNTKTVDINQFKKTLEYILK